jgi:EAL domain-containing protein (putative c-di-GMP-specific phosphodiesterase class I)
MDQCHSWDGLPLPDPPAHDLALPWDPDWRELLADLPQAIERKQITPFYQPVIDLRGPSLAGFECLARWNHPKRGWIAPARFVPLAIAAGWIDAMSSLLLRQACRDLRKWRPRHTLALNLAPPQLLGPFPDECIAILDAAGIDPERLILEVTEELAITELGKARSVVERLRRHGIAFALDDFGKGMANLHRLRELRFDHIKIDREVIALGGGDGVCDITRTVVALAQALDQTITAEGVETAAQCAELAALGCTHAQGFYFSAAVPAAVAATLARRPDPLIERVRRATIEFQRAPATPPVQPLAPAAHEEATRCLDK